jgi:hypothetical protein
MASFETEDGKRAEQRDKQRNGRRTSAAFAIDEIKIRVEK